MPDDDGAELAGVALVNANDLLLAEDCLAKEPVRLARHDAAFEAVIVGVRTDPEPNQVSIHFNGKGTILQATALTNSGRSV